MTKTFLEIQKFVVAFHPFIFKSFPNRKAQMFLGARIKDEIQVGKLFYALIREITKGALLLGFVGLALSRNPTRQRLCKK